MNEFFKGILDGINLLFGNYGWSIIVFTFLVRLVLFPFDYKSRVSMRKTTKIQPQIAALQKKYANDKDKLNNKMAELYKKEKINPLSSCLPMLLTWPLLIAMFTAMRMVANEQLVQQAFDILMGNQPVLESWLWIKNLWMADSPFAAAWPDLASLQQIPADVWQAGFAALGDQAANLPAELALTADSFTAANLQGTIQNLFATLSAMPAYVEHVAKLPGWSFNLIITVLDVYKNYNGWFLLPILSAVSQYLMTALQPTQPAADNKQQQSTNNFMKWFFPLFSLFLCFSYSAAFALYWVASNLITMAQTYGINWYLDRKEKQAETIGEGTVK